MDDVAAVGKGHGIADLQKDLQEPYRGITLEVDRALIRELIEDFQKRLPFDHFHGEEAPSVLVNAEVVNRRYIWVLETAGNACLAYEALHEVYASAVQKDLLGHFPIERAVVYAMDGPHAATADLLDLFVGPPGFIRFVGGRCRLVGIHALSPRAV